MKGFGRFLVFISVAVSAAIPLRATALPFNNDMVSGIKPDGTHMYYSTGQIMRERAPGTVAMGELKYDVKSKEEAQSLQNPIKGDESTVPIGKRLFQVNCSPCHGNIELSPYQPGPVAAKFIPPPDITQETYRVARSDGYIYGVMNFGGLAVMPPVGWKLSPTEHWEIINYIRHVQAVKAQAGK